MSLPSSITLAVDEENDGVGPVNHVYELFDGSLSNRSIFVGPDHTISARNTLTFYRTLPKSSGNFRGVAKTAFKFSCDTIVDGVDGVSQLTAPMIVEVSFSLPVGVTAAESLIMRQKALALLDLDTVMAPLNDQQMV